MKEIRIGCSGWSYESWEGIFYPKWEKNKLAYYSKIFNTVEVDSTFYSFPEKYVVESWYKNTPQDFIFSVKIPRLITHEERLSASSLIVLRKFINLLEPLKDKLGVLLIQLPPSFNRERYWDRFEKFISSIEPGYRWAVEFRDESWLSDKTFEFLSRHEVAYTIVDEPLLPNQVVITAEFSLIRFHGRGKSIWYNYLYSEEEIEDWAFKVEEITKKCKRVYSYFNNHYRAFAALNALQLMKRLNIIKNEELLEKLKLSLKTDFRGLLSFAEERKSDLIEELKKFTTESRFERAINIPKEEIKIDEASEKRLRGWVSGYFIEINFAEKKIKHECQDWINSVSKNEFLLCKHIIAFMRELSDSYIKKLLSIEKKDWKLEGRISL